MSHFNFKQFTVWQNYNAMKVCTDACLFGAWAAATISAEENPPATILDIGTGTGVLSLMLAQKVPSKIYALEINAAAAAEAAYNITEAKKENQITVIPEALQQFNAPHLFDAIICNPPFFKQSLKSPNPQKNLVLHEDNLPLTGLLHFIQSHLTPCGKAFLLLPAQRKAEVLQLIEQESLGLNELVEVQQTNNHTAFRIFLSLGKQANAQVKNKTLIIKSGDEYTAEFVAYLKDYYLHLG